MKRAMQLGAVICGTVLVIGTLAGCGTKQAAAAKQSAAAKPGPPRAGKVAMTGTAMAAGGPEKPNPKPTNATEALQQAQRAHKHLVVLAYAKDDDKTKQMKAVFAKAQKSLAKQAILYQLRVGDQKESGFVREYQLAGAPLPLTLVFAPNRAIVNAYVQKVVDERQLADSLASPKLAEVLKLLQERKLVLVCIQGSGTKHNAESMKAARDVVADEKANGAIQYVRVDPRDEGSADLLRQLNVEGGVREAALAILVPPGTVAATVPGATTKNALWDAIVRSVQSCGAGCGPSGCG